MRVASRIEPVNQAASITVWVPSIGRALTVRTDWTTGRRAAYRWSIRKVPPEQSVRISIAGRAETVVANASGVATFDWDGTDVDGEIVGRARATAEVPGGLRRTWLGRWNTRALGLGGLLLDPCDRLEPESADICSGRGRLHGSVHLQVENGEYWASRRGGRYVSRFDGAGRHLAVYDRDRATERWRFEYDDAGIVRARGPAADDLVVERSADTCVLSRGAWKVELSLDGEGRAVSLADSSGATVSLAYSTTGLLTHVVDAAGFHRNYDYDDAGRLVRFADPGRGPVDIVRRPVEHGHEVTMLTAEGRESSYQVQRFPDGTRVRTSRCCGGATTVARQRRGRTEISKPDGTTVVSERGLGGSSVRVVSPSGIEHLRITNGRNASVNGNAYERLAANGRMSETTPEGRERTAIRADSTVTVGVSGGPVDVYELDERDRIVRVRRGSSVHRFDYGEDGMVREVAGSDGSRNRFERDTAGWLRAHERADGSVIRFGRDGAGQATQVFPPAREATRFEYTAPGEISRITFPSGGPAEEVVYGRDRDGLIVSRQVSGGPRVDMRRGPLGLIDAIGAGDDRTRVDYDRGRPVRLETPSGLRTDLVYDGPRLAAIERTGSASGRLDFEHGPGFRLDAIRSGDIGVEMRYDGDGSTVGVGAIHVERDAAGRVSSATAGPVRLHDAYDDMGRLAKRTVDIGGDRVWGIAYGYDAGDRIVSIDDSMLGGVQALRYDAVGRLLESAGPHPTAASYDDGGAMIGMRRGDQVVVCKADLSDRVVQAGDRRVDYGPGGVMAHTRSPTGSRRLEWDPLGRLIACDGVRYVRDGLGVMVALSDASTGTVGLLAVPDGRVFGTLDSNGEADELFGRATPWDPPILAVRGDRELMIVSDHVGSPRILVDIALGEVVERRAYDAWGVEVHRAGDAGLPFGFAGGIDDRVTGLVHFPARSYDPELRTWLSRDPRLFLGGSLNLYSYCDNDPVNHRDPTGREVQVCRRMADFGGHEVGWHTFLESEGMEAGIGQDPSSDTPFMTAVVDHTGQAAQAECDPVEDVDEECVQEAMELHNWTADGTPFGDRQGWYAPGNTCGDWVKDVLDSCSGGDYKIVADDPDAYDHWSIPDMTVVPADATVSDHTEDPLESTEDQAGWAWE